FLKRILFPVIFLLPLFGFSQIKEQQVADQYFYKQEYDKAAAVYEKLYDKNPFVYNNYLRCLFELNQTDRAEKLVKKQMKKNPGDPVLLVDLGQVYSTKGNVADARKQFESAIRMLPPDQAVITNAANALLTIREQDYALQAYLEGRKLLRGIYTFRFELAQLYFLQQDY